MNEISIKYETCEHNRIYYPTQVLITVPGFFFKVKLVSVDPETTQSEYRVDIFGAGTRTLGLSFPIIGIFYPLVRADDTLRFLTLKGGTNFTLGDMNKDKVTPNVIAAIFDALLGWLTTDVSQAQVDFLVTCATGLVDAGLIDLPIDDQERNYYQAKINTSNKRLTGIRTWVVGGYGLEPFSTVWHYVSRKNHVCYTMEQDRDNLSTQNALAFFDGGFDQHAQNVFGK